MTDDATLAARPTSPPWTFLVLGVVLDAIGAGLAALGSSRDSGVFFAAGLVLAGIGGVMVLVGAVAQGVVVGLRYDRESRT